MKISNRTPLFIFTALGVKRFLDWMPDKLYLKIQYRLAMHKKLNLEHPVTYNEKLQWLKLYDRKPEYTMMVDKYAVRQYIVDKIGEEYSIPIVGGPWHRFEDIDFDKLPDQFVLKCNHDSGGLVICKDKSTLDKETARKRIQTSLNRNFYWGNREWPYKDVKPCIFAEQYMVDDSGYELCDYKFFCFNGEPKVVLVCKDRYAESGLTEDFFSAEWEHLDVRRPHQPNAKYPIGKPEALGELLNLSRKLAAGIPFVRVDFYICCHKIYFGEMTFFPASGMKSFNPEEWDYKFGEWITI